MKFFSWPSLVAFSGAVLAAGAIWSISQYDHPKKISTISPSLPEVESAVIPHDSSSSTRLKPLEKVSQPADSVAAVSSRASDVTLDTPGRLLADQPAVPEPPPEAVKMVDLGKTSLTGLRIVSSPIQALRESAVVGFSTLNLSLPNENAISQGAAMGIPNELHHGDLEAIDYASSLPNGPPFRLVTQVLPSPWHHGYQLILVGLTAIPSVSIQRVPANLTFLIDVSSSMEDPGRLPLIRQALIKFVEQLGAEDRVGIVLYSGTSLKLLPSTAGTDKAKIYSAVYSLQTYPGEIDSPALQSAYDVVQAHFLKEAVNRVILVTDGDFKFGLTPEQGLMEFIDREAKEGIGLSLIGVGTDILSNPEWRTMMQLGRGTYSEVSSVSGAEEVLYLQTRKLIGAPASDIRVEMGLTGENVKSFRVVAYDDHWPSFPASGLRQGFVPYIFSLIEVEPAEGGLAFHPIPVKAYYRPSNSSQLEYISATVPEPNRATVTPLFNIQAIVDRIDSKMRTSVSQKATTEKATDSQSPPSVEPTNDIDPVIDGKVTNDDLKSLEEKARSWMEPPSGDKK